MHFVELVLRRVRPIAKKITRDYQFLLITAAMPLGPLLGLLVALPLQVTVILLYPLSLLPVPGLGALAKAGFRSLSEILGDAFAYASNEVTKVSVETKVRADADWLAERCNTITIVAHSQGAAVALGALVQRPRPCTLITYGSGVRKLLRLEQSHRRSFWLFLIQWAWLYVLGLRWAFDVVAREVSGVLHGFRGAWPEAGMANLYLIAGPFMFYFIFAMLTLGDDLDPVAPALLRKYQALSGLVSWTDLAATADPVPAGLLLRDAPPDVDRKWLRWDSMSRLRSARVCNLASVFEDHTSYWRSLDDFLPRLYDALHSDAGAPDLNLELANPRYGNLWRRARSWLRVASSLTVLALVARLYVAIGEHSRLWVASLAGGWLERWTRYVQQFLPGVNSFGIWGISVALHLGAVALLWRFLTDPAWQAFDEAAALKRRWSCMGFFLLFLALWLAAAHLILAAIRARMYSAIPDDAWRLLYWLHGFMV